MCTIYGAVGNFDPQKLQQIKTKGKLRGRDADTFEKGSMMIRSADGTRQLPVNWLIGNLRAAPTTEIEHPTRLQPYEGIVHNGTIANDKELGNPEDAVDSEIIPRVVDRSSTKALADSLGKLKGSYALAIVAESTVYLAANYKPLYYYITTETTGGEAIYFASLEEFLSPVVKMGTRPVKLEPYSVLNLITMEHLPIPRQMNKKCLAIASAGLDSTVAAAWMQKEGYDVELLHFQYGCKAESLEVQRIKEIAERMNTKVHFLPLGYSSMAGNCPILVDGDIAYGASGAEYAHEWVPARNLVMLSLAVAFAEANGFSHLCLGTNLEESGAYPDNEGEFITLFNELLPNAVNEGGFVYVHQPVGHLMKHEIVKLGAEIKAPLDLTWSCYRAGDRHCGECGPCFMRKTAFARNGLVDPAFQ